MDLIDRAAFDKCLKDVQDECKANGGNFRYGVLNQVRGNLARMPTIEAVPLGPLCEVLARHDVTVQGRPVCAKPDANKWRMAITEWLSETET